MNHESPETIIQSLYRWEEIRNGNDPGKVIELFANVKEFRFQVPKGDEPIITDDWYHIYFGVLNEEGRDALKLYIIPASCDTKESYSEGKLFPGIIPCNPLMNPDENEIPRNEAMALILNWEVNHKMWIHGQAGGEYGMVCQAFAVPGEDLPAGEPLRCFFALKNTGNSSSRALNYAADLVFTNKQGELLYHPKEGSAAAPVEKYYDLARPVPPFKKGTVTAREYFFLLALLPVLNEHL